MGALASEGKDVLLPWFIMRWLLSTRYSVCIGRSLRASSKAERRDATPLSTQLLRHIQNPARHSFVFAGVNNQIEISGTDRIQDVVRRAGRGQADRACAIG